MPKLNDYGQPMKACDMRQCCRGICYLFEVGEQDSECPSFGMKVILSGKEVAVVFKESYE